MIEFKPLTANDIETITSLMQEFYAIDGYPFAIHIYTALIQEFISDENLGKVWLISRDNEILGYVILTFVFSFEHQGRIAFLDELYVVEKARGEGIGNKTIAFVKTESRKLSLKLIYLEVENHNENAQKLYLASDFIFHHRKLMKYIVK